MIVGHAVRCSQTVRDPWPGTRLRVWAPPLTMTHRRFIQISYEKAQARVSALEWKRSVVARVPACRSRRRPLLRRSATLWGRADQWQPRCMLQGASAEVVQETG